MNMEVEEQTHQYNEVGAPLSVRRYGQNGVRKSGDLEIKKYGFMDDLSYVWEGMRLSSVTAQAAGTEFYGRTGYPLSASGGVAQYAWNKAGMLYSDSSRGIKKMTYNHMRQPSTVQFTDGGELQYTYSASGELLGVSTYALLAGKRRPVKVSERSYCGDFVFEGDSLAYVNFLGGYFDGNGGAHYRHPDFQGNITMVTGQEGKIEQHTGYYPYGEPWHEPAGQPYLYGGKERMRDGGLNDYDFSARRLNSALALWSTPDPKAVDFTPINPYVYCAGNPIRYVDPTGCEIYYNLRGIHVLSEGMNDIPYIVLSTSEKRKDAKECIRKKHIIPLPSEKEIEYMSEMYEITETRGIETSYNKFSNGEMTDIIVGTEQGVEIKSSDMPSGSLEGVVRTYNVHTHPTLQSSDYRHNNCASPDDIEDMKNNTYQYPNIVLGYNCKQESLGNKMGERPVYSHERSVAFFDKSTKEGHAITQIMWKTFKKAIEDIYKMRQTQGSGK